MRTRIINIYINSNNEKIQERKNLLKELDLLIKEAITKKYKIIIGSQIILI